MYSFRTCLIGKRDLIVELKMGCQIFFMLESCCFIHFRLGNYDPTDLCRSERPSEVNVDQL